MRNLVLLWGCRGRCIALAVLRHMAAQHGFSSVGFLSWLPARVRPHRRFSHFSCAVDICIEILFVQVNCAVGQKQLSRLQAARFSVPVPLR